MEIIFFIIVVVLVLIVLISCLSTAYDAGFKVGREEQQKTLSYQIFRRMEQNEKRYLYLRRTTTKVVGASGDKVDVTPELMDQVLDENIRLGK